MDEHLDELKTTLVDKEDEDLYKALVAGKKDYADVSALVLEKVANKDLTCRVTGD
ncbi:hypothetical protein HZA55_00880 [Candidatus Poribacteria bacterium]|nr:hypothetical protein [Candidatus Poribacteria bacterium]